MNNAEEAILHKSLIIAIKELGEIADCVVKGDPRPDHWKAELCDLCGLAIKPMLDIAELDYTDACEIGIGRKVNKIGGGV